MEEMFQTALVVAFAAVLLIAGGLYMEYRSTKIVNGPAPAIAGVARGAKNPWGPFPSSATLSLPRRLSLDTN
jgi:hypothetical protein